MKLTQLYNPARRQTRYVLEVDDSEWRRVPKLEREAHYDSLSDQLTYLAYVAGEIEREDSDVHDSDNVPAERAPVVD